jgi:nucleoside phosphorylase
MQLDMSSGKFAAFRDLADRRGSDAAAAVERFLLERRRGQLLAPNRIARETGLGLGDVEDLLEIASSDEVGVLERTAVIACPNPNCAAPEHLRPLMEEEEKSGEAHCSTCEEVITTPRARNAEKRYELTEGADAEASVYQSEKANRPKQVAVILTALPEELSAVRNQLSSDGADIRRRTVTGGGLYYEANVASNHIDWTVYASYTEATPSAAAAGAADAILNFDPVITFYVGIAGGIREKGVKLGDVVAATEVIDYDGGKESPEGYIPRPRQLHPAFALKQLAGFTSIEDEWRKRCQTVAESPDLGNSSVHIEPIAAGNKVVASTKSATYKLIRATADRAVAVEMEGSGFLSAVARYGDAAIVIRGISDLIDGKKQADKDKVRAQAAANAAAFALELLHQFELQPGKND